MSEPNLTVVVTRKIRPGREEDFEADTREFLVECGKFPGFCGLQMLRAVHRSPDATEYGLLARFESLRARRAFTASAFYAAWMQRFDRCSVEAAEVRELTHLDGWEVLAGEAGHAAKWKMALLVWGCVLVLSQSAYFLLGPWIGGWPRPLQAALVTALVVGVLTWLLLPALTRWLKGWLEGGRD